VPSHFVGNIVQLVKSTPMPITSAAPSLALRRTERAACAAEPSQSSGC
jgi:hypothetical protein